MYVAALVFGFGQVLTFFYMNIAIVSWYGVGQSTVLGVAQAATTVGAAVVTPVVASLLESSGYTKAGIVLTAIIVVTMCVSTLLLCGDMPSKYGMSPVDLESKKDKKAAAPAAQAPAAKTYNVGVVQLVEHQALDAANKGFVDGLASKGFVEGKNVKFDFQNAQADQSNLRNIATRFTGNKVDLIGAIATPAAQTMANATNKIPIVATAVTDFEIAKLVKSNDKPGTNVTGSSDMAPINSLLELIVKIYPNAKNVGVMYSSSEINSERQVQRSRGYGFQRQ